MIIQNIAIFIFVIFLFCLLIYTLFLDEIYDDILHDRWRNTYKWRIVEITHKDNSKTYLLQIKILLIWYNCSEDCSLEACKDCYNTIQQCKKEAKAKKINATIIDKKIINIDEINK